MVKVINSYAAFDMGRSEVNDDEGSRQSKEVKTSSPTSAGAIFFLPNGEGTARASPPSSTWKYLAYSPFTAASASQFSSQICEFGCRILLSKQ